jgi:hypothetical protein
MTDSHDNVLASKEFIGNNFEQRAHMTLDCEDSVGGWQDGYFMVRLESEYDFDMGDVTVKITNTLDQGTGDESIAFGDLTFEYDYDPSVQVATSGQIEYGTINLDHQWQTVQMNNVYVNPVVIMGALSLNGPDPSTVRVKDVTGYQFTVALQEWDYLDGPHATETISYLVAEAGDW